MQNENKGGVNVKTEVVVDNCIEKVGTVSAKGKTQFRPAARSCITYAPAFQVAVETVLGADNEKSVPA